MPAVVGTGNEQEPDPFAVEPGFLVQLESYSQSVYEVFAAPGV